MFIIVYLKQFNFSSINKVGVNQQTFFSETYKIKSHFTSFK